MRWPWKRSKAQAAVTLSPSAAGFLSDYGPVIDDDSDELSHALWSMSAARMYRRQPAVRSVVDFLARNVSQIRLEVMEKLSDGEHIQRSDYPLQGVLDHPLPGVPRSRYMRQVVADLAIFDRMLTLKQRLGPNPADMGLLRVPLKYAHVSKASPLGVQEFEIARNGREPLTVKAADAVYIHGYSPTSNTQGVSPMETLLQMLREEQAAFKDRENYYRNGPRVGGTIEYPVDAPVPGPEGRARQKEDWNSRYQGSRATEAGGVAVLREGGHLQWPPTMTADDAQYVESRQLLREEVCRAYGIPPQILGITPANYATADAYHQFLYQDALGPWWVWLQEEFEEQLLYADFEDLPSRFFLEFDLQAKLAGSFMDQLTAGQKAVGTPWMPVNEWRRIMNLRPLMGPDGEAVDDPANPYNQVAVPKNVTTGGGPQANPTDAQNQFTQALLPTNGNGHEAKHALEVAAWPTQGS